jgi:hypothetical protein
MTLPHDINVIAAWLGVLAGVLTGIASGLFFHREEWLGGYGSWPRRMLRLGHISLFGIAALNFGFALTVRRFGWQTTQEASLALAAANVLMPAVCFGAAWRPPIRQLFFLPVGCVLIAVVSLLWQRFTAL